MTPAEDASWTQFLSLWGIRIVAWRDCVLLAKLAALSALNGQFTPAAFSEVFPGGFLGFSLSGVHLGRPGGIVAFVCPPFWMLVYGSIAHFLTSIGPMSL